MNKRISTLTLFVVGTLLLGLMGAIAALAAPSSAVTGSVAFDQAWYTTGGIGSGSVVKVTVTDADVNVTVASSTPLILNPRNELDSLLGTQGVVIAMPAANEVVGIPFFLDINKTDCTVVADVDEDLTVTVLASTVANLIVQTFGGSIGASSSHTICYNVGAKDTLSVKVWSTQTGETGAVTLTATETGVDTDTFEATVTLVDSATTTVGFLHALNLNTLTTEYTDTTPTSGASVDVNASASVETADPISSNQVPTDDFATQNTQPKFTGTISDSGAGLDVSTILIGIDIDDDGTIAGGEKFVPTVTGADGAVQVTWEFTPSALPEGDIDWQVEATDLAGNVGLSDSDADLTGTQTHIVRIDKTPPDILSALTGNYWDVVGETTGSNRTTSIEVTFNESLNGASVSAADFTVDALTPIGADVFALKPKSVFLTLSSSAAVVADHTPIVAIATGGAVSDSAGNALNVGSETALDSIAPTFTVTLDKTLTKDELVVTISADEKISGVPTVEIWKDVLDTSAEKTLIVIVKTLTSWEAKFTIIGGSDGDKSVYVTGSDLAVPTNLGTKGSKDPTASTAIAFEQDTTAPTVTFDPDGTADVTTATPFVKANYTDANNVTVTKAEFGVKDATLTDVTSLVFSSDNKQWIYAASGLVVGTEYTFKVTGSDASGNELADQSVTFEVAARPLVSLSLVPGNNLISLPGAPGNADINSVGLPAGVVSVITYDPTPAGIAAGGPWLVATRDASGNLVGTLSSIDSLHAYWVETTSSAPIKVDVPPQGFATTPPAISVVNGWNLVPVVSVKGDAPGTAIDADLYFGSTAWITAYWFNTAGNAWVKVLPNQCCPGDTVTVGNGYWLYVGQDGVLVP